jgi:hypothetical protein
VEQWGSVKSKKDKKTPTTNLAHSKDQSVTRDRSDSRGGRGGRGGGRGGRGGVTRGAPAGRGRGATRGGLGVNGHTTRSSHPGSPAHDSADKPTVVDDLTDAPTADNAELSHGAAITGHEPSTSASNQSSEPGTSDSTLFAQSNPTSPPWGASHWSAQDHTMSSNAGLKHSISATPKVTKVPAVSGLSWAQIARLVVSQRPPEVCITHVPQTAREANRCTNSCSRSSGCTCSVSARVSRTSPCTAAKWRFRTCQRGLGRAHNCPTAHMG